MFLALPHPRPRAGRVHTHLRLASVCAVLFLTACGRQGPALSGLPADVRALTGAHTRVVWVQSDGTDPRAQGEELVLMGLDTDDGLGERVILGERSSYVKPLLTPSGGRIVYSTRAVPGPAEVFLLNWDGTGLRKLADGLALATWENPLDSTEWLYLGTDLDGYDAATVVRFPIDAPEAREVVWNHSPVGFDTFQVSADGRHAGGLFPWPVAGVATLPNGTFTKLGEGCWTALASARGPLFWYFDGAHRNLTMVDIGTDTRWMVNVNGAPGFDGAEVFHPRWTNHSRFLTISGPYNQGGPNQARTGGAQAEIYLGRFSADFTAVEAWARVTDNSGGDAYPDVWIDAARSPHPRRARGPVGPPTAPGPEGAAPARADASRVVADVRLTRLGSVPSPEDILPYRNALVINEYEIVNVVEGTYGEGRIEVAQWAIRDGALLPGARRYAGAAARLTLERYDAHGELEGERLIRDRDSDLPVYYDVAGPER
jgi:hypothetical protein